jgi:hypothetical protein
MEMALKYPEVSFTTISNSTGIEMIEKARSLDRGQDNPQLKPRW